MRHVILALLLAACADAPPPDVTLLGVTAWERHPHGLRPRFAPHARPRVRTTSVADLSLFAVGPDGAVRVPATVRRHGGGRFLEASDPLPPAHRLEVRRGDAVLAHFRLAHPTPPTDGPFAHQARARELAAAGDLTGSARAWEAAAEAATADLPGDAARWWRAAANRWGAVGDAARAEAAAARARPLAAATGDEEGQGRDAFYAGLVAWLRGDLRVAERRLGDAILRARRAGNTRHESKALMLLAETQRLGGRHDAARRTLDRATALLGPDAPARARADLQANRAWGLLQGMAHGAFPLTPRAVRAPLEAARAAFRSQGRPQDEANVVSQLGALALLAGDAPAAQRHLADPALAAARGETALFVDLLRGRAALARGGYAEAAAAFSRVEATARTSGAHLDYGWRARFGLGRAHQGEGDHAAARADFRIATAGLDRAARQVGLHQSRAAFFADHQPLLAGATAASLAAGDVDGAFAIADAGRARVLRAAAHEARIGRLTDHQRVEWVARIDRYRAARRTYQRHTSRETLLTEAERPAFVARLARDRAALAEQLDAAHAWLDEVSPDPFVLHSTAAIQRALAPREALLAISAEARFLLRPDSLTALPIANDPLADVQLAGLTHLYLTGDGVTELRPAGVPWSLLSHAGALTRPATRAAGRPIVVGDPDGTLRAAREEARAIAALLPGARLLPGASDPQALLDAVTDARVFHFAGHGASPSRRPWDAHLRLAGDARLTVEDILVHGPRPGLVVLSGCETGRSRPLSRTDELGLAQAFLAAGAGSVLATIEPIDDASARRFALRFFEAGGAARPGPAFRAAIDAARAAGDPAADAFRLWGRG